MVAHSGDLSHHVTGPSMPIRQRRLSREDICAALRTINLTKPTGNTTRNATNRSTSRTRQASSSNCRATKSSEQSSTLRTDGRVESGSSNFSEKQQKTQHCNSILAHEDCRSTMIPACLPAPDPSWPNFPALFHADIVRLVEASNIHKHSDTCYKYWNAKRGEKKTCRMRMPRQLVSMSTIDPDSGHISMKRSDPWINNFNEYLIAACRSNMDIKFIWSGSDAKALVYYITDYVTKMSLSFHDTLSLVQSSITSLSSSVNQIDSASAIEKSRKLVLRCYNTLASQQELSGVQVASYLMNWDDHYTSHKFQGFSLIQVERYLQAILNELRSGANREQLENGQYLPVAVTCSEMRCFKGEPK